MSDELEEGLDIESSSFDDGEKKAKTLGDLWRDNPMVKIGIIGAAVAGVFGTIMMFGGEDAEMLPSALPAGAEISAPPGTEEASPAYIAAIEEQNESRIEEAVAQGGSALPTPIEPPQGRLVVPEEEEQQEDPLQRWRQLQEERLARELEKSQDLEAAPAVDPALAEENLQALADVMSQQMQAILESRSEVSINSQNLTNADFIKNAKKKAAEEAKEAASSGGAGGSAGADGFFEDEDLEDIENVLMPAGEIVYAQTLTEANTDVPGPVLAEIMSGPLAGSRIMGTFEERNELLTLNFDTIVYEGESFGIDAIALDPGTTLPGMATEVDHRYLRRIVLPMAAAFVEGMANAISESGRTTITIEGETVAEETEEADSQQEVTAGIEEAGQELREILEEAADETEVMVKIHAGTPIGVLFVEPVIEGGGEQNENEEGGGAAPFNLGQSQEDGNNN